VSESIKIPSDYKTWWSGDRRVEKYMPKVKEAINRHIPDGTPANTDIYNRVYEAIYQAICDTAKEGE
jgi:hypothetical protein